MKVKTSHAKALTQGSTLDKLTKKFFKGLGEDGAHKVLNISVDSKRNKDSF